MGYRRVQVVADAGEFALRQGRIDVFPAAGEHPVRVEHESGRVTALRAFDVGTQRTYRDQPELRLLPALEPEAGPSLFARSRRTSSSPTGSRTGGGGTAPPGAGHRGNLAAA